jgi:predicted permease
MPDWKPEINKRMAGLNLSPAREDAIIEELSQYLEDCYEESLARGDSPETANRRTVAELSGHNLLVRELQRIERMAPPEALETGATRRGNMISDFLRDLRYGARILAKQPVFTLIAVLSLAVGIGANTAIFSLADSVLLRSLPVRDPGALVQLKWAAGDSFGARYNGRATRDELPGLRVATAFTRAMFEQLQSQQRTLTELFAFAPIEQLNVNLNGESEIASGQVVSGGYYNTLGVTPQLGRMLAHNDDRTDAPSVVVLSARYWKQRLGGDPAVIGKQLNVNNISFTVIGVEPPEFKGAQGEAQSPDLTIALSQEPLVRGGGSAYRDSKLWWLLVMGRLKPGMTRAQVEAELAVPFQQRAMTERNLSPDRRQTSLVASDAPRLLVAPGRQGDTNWGRSYHKSLYLLMAVGGLVLLLACVNVANLTLARAAGRQKEMAVRLSLGARRGRLMRQLLTESALLATAGGALGLLLALWGRDLLLGLRFPGQEMSALQAGLDWRLLGLTLATTLMTGLLFGLAPAWQATGADLTPALKETGRSSYGRGSARMTRTLVVAQVAISLLLLVGAGLFLRTLRNLQQVDVGFAAQNLLLFRVDPRLSGYEGDAITSLYQRLFAQMEAIPGVRAVTFSRHPLLSGSRGVRGLFFAEHSTSAAGPQAAHVHIVRSNFLESMNIPLLLGRGLREQDDAQSPKVAVINQTLARRLFPDQNAIGRRFNFNADAPPQIEVVGVAQDSKYDSLRDDSPPTVYIPWRQEGRIGQMNFEIRTTGDASSMLPAVWRAVREVDSNLPLFDVKTQAEQVTQSMAQERLFAALLSFFGLLALLLAALGLYGLLAQTVAQRTQEIGVRVALGAQPRDVLRLILGQGMRLVAPGVVIGLAGAYAVTRLIAGFLYGVSAADWPTYSGIAALLLVVALAACWIPARRATKVDPLVALRCE